jgi:hypothetical protein
MFIPRIKGKELTTGIVVKDTSGMKTGDNPGGYGGTNITANYTKKAKLFITPITDELPESAPIDVTSVMGENDGEYLVYPWQIVSSWKTIPSQKYKIRYVVTATGDDGISRDYEAYIYFVTYLQVQCCIDTNTGKTANVKFDSLFKDEPSRTLAEMSVLINRAKDLIGCGNLDLAERIVTDIRQHCNCINC